jgi:aspartate/methionine/tyrosine aminotransferase
VGLFLWARAPGSLASVEELADDLLEQAQVFLTPGFIFGEGGRRYARSSLCVPPPRLDEALRRVEAFALHRCCAEGNCK